MMVESRSLTARLQPEALAEQNDFKLFQHQVTQSSKYYYWMFVGTEVTVDTQVNHYNATSKRGHFKMSFQSFCYITWRNELTRSFSTVLNPKTQGRYK